MAKNFAEIAFTNAVKELQEKHGSRFTYERIEKINIVNGLSENELLFIENCNSFYMASIGDNSYPYIQHRGGPKGFVKAIDKDTLGFIDFSGNKQYITVGNLVTNNYIALIMVDYTAKARLKILAKAEVVELKDNPSLFKYLDLKEYKFKPERMMLLHVEAYDWNCPQHITPRYTIEDIDKAFTRQTANIAKLEAELKALKQKFSS